MKKPDLSGAYTKSKDDKKDAYLTRNLSAKEKAQFENKDDAHGKKKRPKTMREDAKVDVGIIKTIDAKEGGRLEKALAKDAAKTPPKPKPKEEKTKPVKKKPGKK